ncbi:AraC family transcriptional regulator [Variovorax sp. J2P1-59]|uniref:helix-turn-helix domain-containing protein n=1 Tax=Variovorax flavidus TaxID=3053501 RepID=UPI0025779181|nr:AraC family transcriptional regulator [Variovorax sp. J2P1-59]MDM0074816.1 AraC family transcriptional regulator [Variovorax sp. J2P1-59]
MQVFLRRPVQESLIIPAVPEPLIVWVLSGSAVVEERELGGQWIANHVRAGDFFLTTSPKPCELRWATEGEEPFQVMHLYLGLDVMKRAVRDVHGADPFEFVLREVSGANDSALSMFLSQIRAELMGQRQPSTLMVQGLAQGLAVHLVRAYADAGKRPVAPRGGLPAFKLHRIIAMLEERLDREFRLQPLASAAGLSEFHFCRAFKKTTGFSPSRYFIRLRVDRARRLLRETSKPVIEVGLDVGYASPSHFAQVFKREVGVTPSEYRGRV